MQTFLEKCIYVGVDVVVGSVFLVAMEKSTMVTNGKRHGQVQS